MRPRGAFEARAALITVPWPTNVAPHAVGARSEQSSEGPKTGRLQPEGAALVDTWTGRRIERFPLTDAALARARSFARAGHPALQCILRVDRQDQSIWLEAPSGRPVEGSLTPAQRSLLASALGALHHAGGVHGHLDAAHVVTTQGGVVLRFHAAVDPTATADRDWLALSRM